MGCSQIKRAVGLVSIAKIIHLAFLLETDEFSSGTLTKVTKVLVEGYDALTGS